MFFIRYKSQKTDEGGDIVKKRMLAIILTVAVILSMTVYAVEPRSKSISPRLTFSNMTANCSVDILGSNDSDSISATIKLCRGTEVLETWYESGDGYIFFSDTYTVDKTGTYKLTVDATINGTTYPTVSKTATCR